MDFEWLLDNLDLLKDVFLGAAAVWIFLGKKYREIIKAPFRKKTEKLTLDTQELDFVERLQKFQEAKLTKMLEENELRYAQLEELKLKSANNVRYIERCHDYIKESQRIMNKNNIKYPEFVFEQSF